MEVEVCYATPERAVRVALEVDADCTVAQAVARSGLVETLGLKSAMVYAVFGRRASPDAALSAGDRIEILRPLIVDPMEARRRRAAKKRRVAGSGPA